MRPALFLLSIIITISFGIPVRRDSLNNGLILLTCEDHRLPIVDLALICRSGAGVEPKEKAGIATLCARMLLRGTTKISADSIATLLDYLGARYSAGADFDHLYLNFRLLSKDLSSGLDLLADLTLNPAFPNEEFIRTREEVLTAARRAYENPGVVVAMEFDRLLFGNHRYALPVSGDTATIPDIKVEDLRQFHQTYLVPNNCFVIAVGDINPQELQEAIYNRFGNWRPKPVPQPLAPEFKLPEKTVIKLITRKDMNQTYIHFGHPGISALDSDLIPVRLMSYILGGPPLSSRLGLAVREYAGLAYDVRCWFDRRLLTGAFRATVQTAKPAEAIKKMFIEIRRMNEAGATQQELFKAHNYFTGSFPLTYSSNQGKLEQIKNQELYRYGTDWLETYPQKVRATTLKQVNSTARERLKPDHYIMVIMGNVSRDDLHLQNVEWLE